MLNETSYYRCYTKKTHNYTGGNQTWKNYSGERTIVRCTSTKPSYENKTCGGIIINRNSFVSGSIEPIIPINVSSWNLDPSKVMATFPQTYGQAEKLADWGHNTAQKSKAQTDRKTGTQDKQTERQVDRQAGRKVNREMYTQTIKRISKQTDEQAGK